MCSNCPCKGRIIVLSVMNEKLYIELLLTLFLYIKIMRL